MQRPSTLGSRCRKQRSLRPDGLVEPVQDGGGVDQRLAIIEDKRGDAAKRIDAAHRIEVREHRARVVLMDETQNAQRHRNATDIG